ncbi:MAG: MFS transporter [Alphaproteobacteria bacterium]|nr:MFS transporter [Alphaproteobacteria bacterium]
MTSPEQSAVRHVMWRIVPLLFAAYFVAYIDRVNVGFAALTMNADLGLNAEQYGLAGGLFFVGYVAFSVPSNLILARLGARLWIPLITTLWGIASLLNAFVTGAHSFYLVRFILGLGESGLYPGLLYILTMWAPERYRVRMLMLMILSTPFSIMVGSLISQPILQMDGIAGLAGWQWLFVLQALPTIALGLAFRFALPAGPADAPWLPAAEKQWLVTQLDAERAHREGVQRFSVMEALTNRTVWLIALAGVGINAAAYGLILFLPQMIHQLGVSAAMTPLVNAIPFAVASVAMVFWSIHSDARRERNWHAAIPAAISGLGLIACVALDNPIAVMVALTLGISGVFCYVAVFWAVPSAMLTGAAAAAGLAMINAVANLGSFFGPTMVGWVRDVTGNYSLAIMILGLGPLAASVIAASLRGARRFEGG